MRVCYQLRREIEDLFPADCTPAERLVALEIAEFGRQDTRISLITLEYLCLRTGLKAEGIKRALQRLDKRGLQFRRSFGNGRDGRPVYRKPGTENEYMVPTAEEFEKASGGTTVPPHLLRIKPPRPTGKPVDKPP
jgi:hypothetical protein